MLLESRGYFWWADAEVPSEKFAPDSAVSGVLKISDEGIISVELDGIIREGKTILSAAFSIEQIDKPLYGIIADRPQHVRLDQITPNGSKANFVGPSSENLLARQCILSHDPFGDFRKPLKIDKVRISLDGYEDWLAEPSINVRGDNRRIEIEYRKRKDHQWKIDQGRLSIRFDLMYPLEGKKTSVSISEKSYLDIDFRKGVEVNESINIHLRAEELIILLTDSHKGFDFPYVRIRKQKHNSKLYYHRSERRNEQVTWHRCWFIFPSIKDLFGVIFGNWLTKHREYGPGYHLYMGNRRIARMYPEHRFANLIWGLESLHRSLAASTEDVAIQAKIDRILHDINLKKDQKWARKIFDRAKEPSLAKRLEALISRIGLKLSDDSIKKFSERCAKRRNDLSHFGGARSTGSYREFLQDISSLTPAIDILYHAFLLSEIGVPTEQIQGLLENGFRSNQMRLVLSDAGLQWIEAEPH